MAKKLLIYLSAITITASAIYLSSAAENSGYRERFIGFLEKSSGSGDPEKKGDDSVFIDDGEENSTGYRRGDWYEYTSYPYRYTKDPDRGNVYSDENVRIDSYGTASIKGRYGKSYFTDKKYRQYDDDRPVSRVVNHGFLPEQIVQLHVEGEVGDRVTVYIDHDSQSEENRYLMKYRALSDDELVREVNAGEIDVKFNHSKYAVYDNTDAKALGIDFTLGRKGFLFKGFGSVARGKTAVDYFRGNSSQGNIKLAEYQYVRKTYYQIEPFVRYDNVSSLPDAATIYGTVTLTSAPLNPENYSLTQVRLSADGFELYIDDQNQYNNLNAITLSMDGGFYTRLVNGADYTVNYTTGVITLLRDVPDNSRIFAVYNRSGGTLDPCALPPGDPNHPGGSFAGRIFVFIKYGNSINEDLNKNFIYSAPLDRNNDGKLNLDIYEIRSFYYLGSRNIVSGSLSLGFWKENSVIPDSEKSQLSGYSIDYPEGMVHFSLREPFRVLSGSSADYIYSETRLSNTYSYSRYSVRGDYSVEARSFRLSNVNLIEKSVRVKINSREISASLYTVDYTSGYVAFTDPNNPVIGSDTAIEIKYEYLPFGKSEGNFIGGFRGDYTLSKDLRIGGSVLLSKNAEGEIVPDAGDEPESTLLFEGDATLKLGSKRLTDLYRNISGDTKRTVPAEFTFYAEHARSIKNINTFGKALIDNMESSDETLSVSLSEKDWILSSMPSGFNQGDRGILNYYYYRDPSSPETLKGTGFTPYSVDYSVKPGPFNIATGHVANSITPLDNQRSLVFDFDLTSGQCFSAVTRELTGEAADLSGIQYVELWVRYEGGTGDIQLGMDIGSVNEDSDGDGVLDTEDANRNGYIDSEPSSGYSEDRGYSFNGNVATKIGSGPGLSSSTRGDGVLNTEDLNGNGVLDTEERVFSVNLGSISAGSTGWQKIRIYIDRSTLSSSEKDILKQSRSIRFYATGSAGATGRLLIDSMKLISSRWTNAELDGVEVSDPSIIKSTMVDSINDSDYRADSFLIRERGVYESLYGNDSTDDIDSVTEKALEVEYSIPAGNSGLSLTRRFTREIDFRYYKTLNAWINARSISAGNSVSFIIGSSDYDFIEYRTVPASTAIWEGLQFRLSGDSSGSIDKYAVTGSPDMRRIRFLRLQVNGAGTAGMIWFNEIYLSDPVKQEGDARWYEWQLKILRPLIKTAAGTPLLSDLDLRYVYKGVSSAFSSVNRTDDDISEKYHEFFSSTRILPNWSANADYIRETSVSDSLDENLPLDRRGRINRNYLLLNSVFNSTGGSVPSVSLSYSLDTVEGDRDLEVSGTDYGEKTEKTVHSPVISWRQEFADFLMGKLSARVVMNMLFTENRAKRSPDSVPDSVLAGYVNLREGEKSQKADAAVYLDYVSGGFFLKPTLNLASSEIVEWEGDSNSYGISDRVSGDYHLPFLPAEDMKLLERNNSVSLSSGYSGWKYLSPEYSMRFGYRENGFEDYSSGAGDPEDFSRSKNSISTLTTGIKIPFMLKKISGLEAIRHFQLNYTRDLTLTETDVPFEGEETDYFSEEYGISRVFSRLGGDAFNIFSAYPGGNFRGRGNYAAGRDLVFRRMNSKIPLMDESGSVEYDNALKLDEKFTADLSADLKNAGITLSASLGQVCERGNLYGIPGQVVTWQAGISSDIDLMKTFSSGFFRENGAGLPYHASTLNAGIDFTESMLITENIDELKVSPNLGVTFKIDRVSFGCKGSIDYRKREREEFIDYDTPEGSDDYIYISNMAGDEKFSETDRGYKFSAFYETDVKLIYDYFSLFYKLNGLPVFNIEYSMQIDRYDYTQTVSPEPYDMYMLKGDLKLDLHKNVRGNMAGIMVLEKFRNRENNGVSREVFSYEINGTLSLIF